jgi:mannose-1-phosphate guanylyltransferase/phosphomannomutase
LASFFDEDGSYVTPAQTLALGCVAAFEKGEDVALPYDAPHVIDDIAAKYGRHVLRYLSCPADKSDAQARKLALSQTWVRDGLANAIRVLAHVKTRGITLAKMSKQLPDFAVSVKAVTCTVNPGLILRSLMSEKPDQPSEGVLLSRANGRVLVNPLKRGTGLRIMAEAADMETASELCAEMERKLNGYGAQAIDNSKNNS